METKTRYLLRYGAVVFRHGDRSPTFNCMEPNVQASAEEAAAWAKMLPTDSFQKNLAKAWPVSTQHEATRDEALGIFGSLTQMGVYQVFRLGRVLAGRYFRHGLLKPHEPCGLDISVHSSNYKRTQLSAQSFLLGLFPKHRGADDYLEKRRPISVEVSEKGDDYLNVWATSKALRNLLKDLMKSDSRIAEAEQRPEVMLTKDAIMTAIPAFHYFIRPFVWTSVVDHFHCRSARASARFCFFQRTAKAHSPVLTPGMKAFMMDKQDMDPLGQLTAFSDISKVHELFREFDSSGNSVLYKDDVALLLQNVLGVVSPTEEDAGVFFKALDTDSDGAIALDELVAFMVEAEKQHDHYNDGYYTEVHTLDHWHTHALMSEKALGWRFDFWVRNEEVRRLALSGVASRLLGGMKARAEWVESGAAEETKSQSVQAFAAHDVTLIPLLFAMGVWSCQVPDSDNLHPKASRWPGYASAVVFELYQDLEDPAPSVSNDWRGWYIKIFVQEGIGTGHKYLDDALESADEDEWNCPPSSVVLDNIVLPGSEGRCVRDDSPVGKDECLVPMGHFAKWLGTMT